MRTIHAAAMLIAAAIGTTPAASHAQTGFPVTDARGGRGAAQPTAQLPPAQAEERRRLEERRRFRPPALFGDRPPITGYRAPVTIIYGQTTDQVVPYPRQFNLPDPAYGLVWMRAYNDAVLYDRIRGTIVEVRQRWFG